MHLINRNMLLAYFPLLFRVSVEVVSLGHLDSHPTSQKLMTNSGEGVSVGHVRTRWTPCVSQMHELCTHIRSKRWRRQYFCYCCCRCCLFDDSMIRWLDRLTAPLDSDNTYTHSRAHTILSSTFKISNAREYTNTKAHRHTGAYTYTTYSEHMENDPE